MERAKVKLEPAGNRFSKASSTKWVATPMNSHAFRAGGDSAHDRPQNTGDMLDQPLEAPRVPRAEWIAPTPSPTSQILASALATASTPASTSASNRHDDTGDGFPATMFKASDFDNLMPPPLPEVRRRKVFNVVDSSALLSPLKLRAATPPNHRTRRRTTSPPQTPPNPSARSKKRGTVKTYAAYGARPSSTSPHSYLRPGLRSQRRQNPPSTASPSKPQRYKRPLPEANPNYRKRTSPQASPFPAAALKPPPHLQKDDVTVRISLQSLYAESVPRESPGPGGRGTAARGGGGTNPLASLDRAQARVTSEREKHPHSRPSRADPVYPGADIEHLAAHTRRRRRHKFRRRRSKYANAANLHTSPHPDGSLGLGSEYTSSLASLRTSVPSTPTGIPGVDLGSLSGSSSSSTYSSTTTPTESFDSAEENDDPLVAFREWTKAATSAYVDQMSKLPALIGHSVCASAEFVIVFGGLDARAFPSKINTNKVYVSPKTETRYCELPTRGPRPPPVHNHVSVLIGKYMYVYGGMVVDASGRESPASTTVYRLDLGKRAWSRMKITGHPPPPGNTVLSGYAVGDKVFVMVGVEDHKKTRTPLFILDTKLCRWIQDECVCPSCVSDMTRSALFVS